MTPQKKIEIQDTLKAVYKKLQEDKELLEKIMKLIIELEIEIKEGKS